jgi:hypothetical protein
LSLNFPFANTKKGKGGRKRERRQDKDSYVATKLKLFTIGLFQKKKFDTQFNTTLIFKESYR